MRLFPKRIADGVRDWMLWRWMDIRPQGGAEYLTRLYLFQCPWFGIKVHWFHSGDPDQDCHDHPWTFLSFVLRGRYQERRQTFEQRGRMLYLKSQTESQRGRWSWALRRSGDVHKITMVVPKTVTIIFNGPKHRSWYFWQPVGKYLGEDFKHQYRPVPWRTYLGCEENTPSV